MVYRYGIKAALWVQVVTLLKGYIEFWVVEGFLLKRDECIKRGSTTTDPKLLTS